ncbi:MAG: DUF4350 domain-containing protein [Deltaproteobacteria bacterium]|nr:DUF4350 domain-containing protein [Deltaproteobacteria bacterium]
MAGEARPRSRRGTVITVILTVALLCTGLALFTEIGVSSQDQNDHDFFSSLSPAPDGAKALHTLLGDLGYRTSRLLETFEPEGIEEVDVLVVIQPVKPITDEERGVLVDWLERGGTMLLAGGLASGGEYSTLARDPDDPFARHVRPLHGSPTPGGSAAPGDGDEEHEWKKERSDIAPVLLAGVDTFEYRHILTDRLTTLRVEHRQETWRRGPHELLMGEQSGFIEVSTAGRGRVIKILDESILLNRSIRLGDNLVFVLNVLEAYVGKGRVAFDEGHRSLMPGDEPNVWEVLGPASEMAFLQLMLAVLVGIVALGWRLAPALPERRERRRRALQQVEALAGMMERAGSVRLALGLMHRRTEHLWRIGRFAPPAGQASAALTRRQEQIMDRMRDLAAGAAAGAGRKDLTRYIALFRQLKKGERKR